MEVGDRVWVISRECEGTITDVITDVIGTGKAYRVKWKEFNSPIHHHSYSYVDLVCETGIIPIAKKIREERLREIGI